MTDSKDQLYKDKQANLSHFRFDEKVAEVFADMISRSVPGYQQILELLPTLTRQFRVDNANYYDLGCSLGAGMIAIARGLDDKPGHIIGIDNSQAMLDRAKPLLSYPETTKVEFICKDLLESQISNSAMVVMNFTLQFIAKEKRDRLIQNIYQGLLNGGALILSEKVCFEDAKTAAMMTDIHHQYKQDQGYSRMEIAQKRDAIENILIPETLDTHIERLHRSGFEVVTPWIQNLQFVSLLAVK